MREVFFNVILNAKVSNGFNNSRGALIFNEEFDELDESLWTHYVSGNRQGAFITRETHDTCLVNLRARLREGVKKTTSYGPVLNREGGGGGANPLAITKIGVFF